MGNLDMIQNRISSSIAVKEKLLKNTALLDTVEAVAKEMLRAFQQGGKVLFCGNGGSAADAQHLAAELSGRFYSDREPLYSEALHVNTSYLTAVANDYSYNEIFSRMIRAQGRKGDVLVGISTSGNSANVLKAFEEAKKLGVITVAMTGESGGKMKDMVNYLINVPSTDTPRIQESHILVGHILCEWVELNMFNKS